MKLNQILLIEDDLLSRISLEQKLRDRGMVKTATSSEEAKAKINSREFQIAFVDLDLDRKLEGLSLISILKKKNIYTVILSAREEDNIIRMAYENGCDDYLVKPFNSNSINLVFKKYDQKNVKSSIQKMLVEKFHSTDSSFADQIEVISNSLLSTKPILIEGETGTGKTYLAKLIHELSGQHLPFIQVNCSEFSEGLLESELFGHEKGSFTGAIKNKKGILELVDGGILFLDEIATMSNNLQKKILKAIEEKEFYPVGSEKRVKTNFRLISATCESLKTKIEKNEFRQDLYFRIDGFKINMKPLRERNGDIQNIVKYFVKTGDRRVVFEEEAMEVLKNYSWPGNVRELENVIDILRLKGNGVVSKLDLDFLTKDSKKQSSQLFSLEEIRKIGLNNYVENIEMDIVEKTFKKNNEKVRKTLTDLKLSNNSFYRIMDNLKLRGNEHAR